MIDYVDLPPPTPRPCSDCPWRRNASPGWLGPNSPEEWIALIHGEAPIACHQTIIALDNDERHAWDEPGLRQCRGAAVYRRNVSKMPRNPSDAAHDSERDAVTVFASDAEFLEYHKSTYARIYEKARR